MAVRTRIAVEFGEVFPRGALVLGVEPVQDFEKMQAKAADPQERDKETGERVWLVRVIDLDTENQRKGTAEVGVKITAPHQPVPPSPAPGSPLPAVEFVGLTLTPWVDSQKCSGRSDRCRSRQAYSLRAASLREPGAQARKSAPAA